MIIKITPSVINGTIEAPASKSYAQRALAAALLSEGTTILRNPSRCNDAVSAMQVIEQLGAGLEDFNDRLIVHGGLKPASEILHFGESGLGIRLFSSIAALLDRPMILTGEGSLKTRPMKPIADALHAAGAHCETNQGFLPISVKGPLQGGTIAVDGSLSSQVLTGLIMALPMARNDSIVHVSNLKSTPYIDMTWEVMDLFGIEKSRTGYEVFRIPGKQKYQPAEFAVEGDWSGSAFLLVAGALAGKIVVNELRMKSFQADKAIMDALQQSGAKLEYTSNSVQCSTPDQALQSFFIDATHCPDLFPPLAALAAHADGISIIKGVHRLFHKESNRAQALLEEFRKLGVNIHIHQDEMIIEGPTEIKESIVESHNDHRIAMAAAVVALRGKNEVIIQGAACVNKSYPDFWKDLNLVGVKANEQFR